MRRLYCDWKTPGVSDADALNVLAGDLPAANGKVRVLAHPGEISTGWQVFRRKKYRPMVWAPFKRSPQNAGATVVLKGDSTVIAFPDGET